jgi:hypothetical protein
MRVHTRTGIKGVVKDYEQGTETPRARGRCEIVFCRPSGKIGRTLRLYPIADAEEA